MVTVERTAALRDGWSDDGELAFLAKYNQAIRTAVGTTCEQLPDRLPGDHSRLPDSDEGGLRPPRVTTESMRRKRTAPRCLLSNPSWCSCIRGG